VVWRRVWQVRHMFSVPPLFPLFGWSSDDRLLDSSAEEPGTGRHDDHTSPGRITPPSRLRTAFMKPASGLVGLLRRRRPRSSR
jgi:hypothetical protein